MTNTRISPNILRNIALLMVTAVCALGTTPIHAAESSRLIWPRIAEGLSLVDAKQPETVELAWKFASNPDHLYDLLARSEPFLWYIVESVESSGMPLEVALLPGIESGFDPLAKSGTSAAGLWQFVPSTGALFGLSNSPTYDANSDPIASTNAAMNYMLALNNNFGGDWMLTLAAYNLGEGRLKRALRDQPNPEASFWKQPIPAEAREHLRRLMGLALVIKEPERFGVKLPPIRNQRVAEVVALHGARNVEAAATAAGVPVALVKRYNPSLKIPSNSLGKPALLLPFREAAVLRRELARGEYPAKPLVKTIRSRARLHQVASGDTLSRLAVRYEVSVEQLRIWNTLHRDQSLRIGRRLLVGPQS